MASQYKNLFFDLDDTLWAFSLNARDTFEEMYHKYDYGRFFRSFLHFYTLYQHRIQNCGKNTVEGRSVRKS